MIDRKEFIKELTEEEVLRENIRHLIRHVKQKRSEEAELRKIVRTFLISEIKMLQETGTPDNDPTPHRSTGINVLEDLLKKIIPVVETDYKLLTTDADQRKSFRAHIINATINTLTPTIANNEAGGGEEMEIASPRSLEEIDVNVGGNSDEDMFIDVRGEDEEEEVEELSPEEEFGQGLNDHDKTGRNMAYASFKKIDQNIIDAYDLLSNNEDQELFYDYLIANLKLYFDKFENELSDTVSEPTNQAYVQAKSEEAAETDEEPAL